MLACFGTAEPKYSASFLTWVEVGVPMDSSQNSPNDQRHKDDIVTLVPGPTAVNAPPATPTRDPDVQDVSTAILSELIDVTAEETCPAVSAQDEASDTQAAQKWSATTFELMSKLEAVASDLVIKEGALSDPRPGNVDERSNISDGLQAVAPSIRVTPRPAGFESDPFTSDRPSARRRTVFALASVFMAALIGFGVSFAWRSPNLSTVKQPNDVDAAALGSAPVAQAPKSVAAPVAQTATVPAAATVSPELVKQLEAITQDLASMRRDVEQLAAKQEYLAAARQQLEQLAAKQDQMAKNIAKLQVSEDNAKPRMAPRQSPPPQSGAVPTPPRVPPEPATQLSSVPRPPVHPVPPLPVPP
jgi:hypothetical protein